MSGVALGESKYEQERKAIEIRIRNEFLVKMKAALERRRVTYHGQYDAFIRSGYQAAHQLQAELMQEYRGGVEADPGAVRGSQIRRTLD